MSESEWYGAKVRVIARLRNDPLLVLWHKWERNVLHLINNCVNKQKEVMMVRTCGQIKWPLLKYLTVPGKRGW